MDERFQGVVVIRAILVQIGNGRGIRLAKPQLEIAGLADDVEIVAAHPVLTITPSLVSSRLEGKDGYVVTDQPMAGVALLRFLRLRPALRPAWWPRWPGLAGGAVGLAALALTVLLAFGGSSPARAAPGLCIGPVCGDEFHRNPSRSYQLRLRLSDQRGHHERITVDCRDGRISPEIGSVERGYGAAVALRACRLSQVDGPQA